MKYSVPPSKTFPKSVIALKKINATPKHVRLKINKTILTDTDKKNVILTAVNASTIDTLNHDWLDLSVCLSDVQFGNQTRIIDYLTALRRSPLFHFLFIFVQFKLNLNYKRCPSVGIRINATFGPSSGSRSASLVQQEYNFYPILTYFRIGGISPSDESQWESYIEAVKVLDWKGDIINTLELWGISCTDCWHTKKILVICVSGKCNQNKSSWPHCSYFFSHFL